MNIKQITAVLTASMLLLGTAPFTVTAEDEVPSEEVTEVTSETATAESTEEVTAESTEAASEEASTDATAETPEPAGEITPGDDITLPEWVPQSFLEAFGFLNDHGKTQVGDGFVCVVRKKSHDIRYIYSTEWTASSPEVKPVFQKTFSFEGLPEAPDKNDDEAYRAYVQELSKYGVSLYDMQAGATYSPDFDLEVTVYKPETDMAFRWYNHFNMRGADDTYTDFSFHVENGEVTETDFWGWLPDCAAEFRDFCPKYDNGSSAPYLGALNGYVIYAASICQDGGYSSFADISGTAQPEKIAGWSCNTQYLSYGPVGGSYDVVRVYKLNAPGTAQFNFFQAQEWDMTSMTDQQLKYFRAADDQTVTEITAEEYSSQSMMGDCDGDGVFTTADIVMCQKYVHGLGKLTKPENADYDHDGTVDIFDLTNLRRSLLYHQASNPEIIDYTVAGRALVYTDDTVGHRYFRGYPAKSLAELKELAGDAEIPDTITEETFAANTVLLIQTPVSQVDFYRKADFEELHRIANIVSIQPSFIIPGSDAEKLEQYAYSLYFLILPNDQIEGVREYQIQDLHKWTKE